MLNKLWRQRQIAREPKNLHIVAITIKDKILLKVLEFALGMALLGAIATVYLMLVLVWNTWASLTGIAKI